MFCQFSLIVSGISSFEFSFHFEAILYINTFVFLSMLPDMDSSRKGGDRRKKESDDKESPSSSSPKYLKPCELCGLPFLSMALLSDNTFTYDNKNLLKICQCFTPGFTKPTVGCADYYQPPSLRPWHQAIIQPHQQVIIQPHQQSQNFMRPLISPSGYYIPRTSVTPFVNLPFASSPGTILHPRTIPLHPIVSCYKKPFPHTIAPKQKPPEASVASANKVSDWLRDQDFLSHTTDQEIPPSPSSRSQTSDEEQLSELQSQLDEEQGARNISFMVEENNKEYSRESHSTDIERNTSELKNCTNPSCMETAGKSSTNLNEETNLDLTEGKMSMAERNKSCNRENIQDSKKDETFFGKEKNLISNNKSSISTSNQVFDAKMSNKEASSGLNKPKDANHHANDRLKNDQDFDNENKQDLNKQGSSRLQKIIKQSNEKSLEDAKRNHQSFNKENSGSNRRKNFKPKKIIDKRKENKDD